MCVIYNICLGLGLPPNMNSNKLTVKNINMHKKADQYCTNNSNNAVAFFHAMV
jgi:hypothetical protein